MTQPTFLRTGSGAMDTLKEEQRKAETRRAQAGSRGPMRFFLSKQQNGSYPEHELVVLDDHASTEAPFLYEHTIPGPNNNWKETTNVTCIDDWDDCPICRAAEAGSDARFERSKYNRYITVLDLEPYTVKSGPNAGTVYPTTRKLYVMPQGAVEQFQQMFELCERENGTTRGMVIVVTKKEKNDARCGIPQMIPDTGRLFDFMPEEELDEYAAPERLSEGKVVEAEGENLEPFDYGEILKPKTPDELRTSYGLGAPAGSNADEQESTGSARRRRRAGTSQDTGAAAEGDAPPPRSRRAARRAETPPPEAEAEKPSNPPRRRRSRAKPEDTGGDEIPSGGS